MNEVQEIYLNSYRKGLVSAGRAWAIDPQALRRCLNLQVALDGSLDFRGGQDEHIPDQADPVQGFARYANTSISRLIYVTGGDVMSRNESAGTESNIGTVHASNKVDVVPFQDKLFIADGSGDLQKWGGSGSIADAGIVAPSTAATAATGAAGLLDSSISGYRPYRWYVTFYAADGTESNPSPVSNELSVTLQQVGLTSVPVSADSQVVGRHIYRDGGSITVARRVGSIADNTTTTFTDNVADIRVGTIQMSTTNDLPPSGLSCLFPYKGRLLGVDSAKPYAIRVSSTRPEYWPEEPLNLDTDGGYLEPFDPKIDDSVVCIGAVGSFALIGRKRSVDILDGRDFNTFAIKKVASYGIAGPRAWARVGGATWFLATDGMVYELSESTPQPVSIAVEDKLKAVDEQYRAQACCGFSDQRFFISLPTTSGADTTVLCYDFRTGAWTDLSGQAFAATLFAESIDPDGKLQLLFSTQAGFTSPGGSAYDGIIRYPDTATTPLPIDFETGSLELDAAYVQKKFRRIRILGSLTIPTGSTVTVTVTAESESVTFTLIGTLTDEILDTRLPASLVGKRLSVRINGPVTAGQIQDITIGYHQVRRSRD